MTQPTGIGERPLTPAPGAPTPELRIARFRPHARRLFWPVVVLIATAAAGGYLWNDMPAPFENWMLLAAVCAVVLVLVLVPFGVWWGHVYTVTTRRVMERRGLFRVRRRELPHVRGYDIRRRRAPLQRLWHAGTLALSDGVDAPLILRNIPDVALVHETLVDQVEVNQILAHRDAASIPLASDADPAALDER